MKLRTLGSIALIVALLVPSIVRAVPPVPESTTQMALAQDTGFRERLMYLMVQTARTVKEEALNTPCHALRTNFANEVIGNPGATAQNAAVMIVGGVNVIGTVTVDGQGKATTTATDAALFSQVNTFWSALARCDTGQ